MKGGPFFSGIHGTAWFFIVVLKTWHIPKARTRAPLSIKNLPVSHIHAGTCRIMAL
jgi:hypothetical protein